MVLLKVFICCYVNIWVKNTKFALSKIEVLFLFTLKGILDYVAGKSR